MKFFHILRRDVDVAGRRDVQVITGNHDEIEAVGDTIQPVELLDRVMQVGHE